MGIGILNVGRGIGPPGGTYSSRATFCCFFLRCRLLGFPPPSEVWGSSIGLVSCAVSSWGARLSSKNGWYGLLCLVLRWCVRLVLRRVVGCVGFDDVDGMPSDGVGVVSTLGSRPPCVGLCNISVSCFRILTCCRRWAAVSGSFPFSASRRSAAAATMRSPSEIVGVLQCAGKSRNVPVVSMPPVIGLKKFMRR